MKTNQYCIIENCDGDITIHTFERTKQGKQDAVKLFDKLAKDNEVEHIIEYNFAAYPDAIANIYNGDTYDLIMVESMRK